MLATLIWKNMLARPLRYVLTGLSIVFGVAAVTAVFIFTDGLRTTFDELGGNIQAGFDIAIQNDSPFGDGTELPPVPVRVADQVAAVDGVVSVQPRVIEFGVVAVDDEGEALIANGPNLGINWEFQTPNPRLFVDQGRAPSGPNEFVLDLDGFDNGDFTIGNTYNVIAPSARADMELVGTFSFGSAERNAAVGAVIIAFSEDQALELLNENEGYDDLALVIDGDMAQVRAEIEAVLAEESRTLIAVPQEVLVADAQEDFNQILGIFQTILLVFAFIILFVVSYLIFNVFNITLGQRIKELGLLRSIGAFGSQITQMMLGEALILGVVATILGVPAGWLLAQLLRFGLGQLGFPGDTGLPIEPRTLIVAVLVGIVVTLCAAVLPSFKARQVTPIAALREGANLDDINSERNVVQAVVGLGLAAALLVIAFVVGGWAALTIPPALAGLALWAGMRGLGPKWALPAQIAVLALGLVLLTIVRFGDLGLAETFGLLGAGALLTIIGASQVSALVAAPVSRMLGGRPLAVVVGIVGVAAGAGAIGLLIFTGIEVADNNPAASSFVIGVALLAALSYGLVRTAVGAFGLTGQLSRENAARSPSRTTTTATALMIGLALVSAVTIIGDSIKTSVSDALGSSVSPDWFVQGPQNGPTGIPFSTDVAAIVKDLDEIDEVVGLRYSTAAFASAIGADADELRSGIEPFVEALGQRDDDPAALLALREELGITDLSIDDSLSTSFALVQEHIDPEFVAFDPTADPATSIWISQSVAEDRGLALGDSFPILFETEFAVVEVTVSGIYENVFILQNRVIDQSLWEQYLTSDSYTAITVTNTEGVEAADARAAIEGAIGSDYPLLTIQDQSEVQAEAETQINQTLATVNVLLALSAAIAILGIAIALSLAVFERTREIGLLRAVGTTRQQTRWMVRWEGVIVAAFGGIVGVVVGVGLGILATQKLPEFLVTTTSLPVGQLLTYILIAAITGLAAGAFPAWIAGRMNVLDAISNE